MRCLICHKFSFLRLCQACQNWIEISPSIRELDSSKGSIKVYSFYAYSEIDWLLHAKYTISGSKIYEFLSQKACNYLKSRLEQNFSQVYGIGIDDRIKKGYAHNAIFLKSFTKLGIIPIYACLHATNAISYAGKDLDFRSQNPRNFKLNKPIQNKKIILFDDLITTGTTIKEAKNYLQCYGNEILMALTLSDARK